MARVMTRISIHAFALLLSLSSCSSLTPSEQLDRMFEKSVEAHSPDQQKSRSEVTALRRDMDRRAVRVREIVENDQLADAEDAYRAAVILYDSQDIDDVILAQELALRAHEDGHEEAISVVAHCMDRSLMMREKPQRFGTQVVYEPVLAKWRLWDMNTDTTDDEREVFGIPPLLELQARVRYLNERL